MLRLKCLILLLALTVPSFSYAQNVDRLNEINELLGLLDNGKVEQSLPKLEQYLTEKKLPDFLETLVTVRLHSYYFLHKDKKFDIGLVNKTIIQYKKSKNSFRNNELFDLDITIFYLGAILNEQVKNFSTQMEYLSFLELNYHTYSKSIYSKDYFSILLALTKVSNELSMADKGIEYAKRAIDLSDSLLSPLDENRIYIHYLLSKLFMLKKNLVAASEHLDKSIIIAGEIYKTNTVKYLNYLKAIYVSYEDLSLNNKVLDIQENIVDVTRVIYGERSIDYLESLNSLIIIYFNQGKNNKALEINLKIVDLNREILGEHSPDYFRSLNLLTVNYLNLGDYDNALDMCKKTTNLSKETLGEHNPIYLTSLNNLAQVYSEIGNYSKALNLQIEVTNLRKEELGEQHPDYLRSLSNLASLYSNLGDYTTALKINQHVVEYRRQKFGVNHPDYLNSLSNLAITYEDLGNYSEALKINEKVIVQKGKIYPSDHPSYLQSLNNLGSTYLALGQIDKALEVGKKVVELCETSFGKQHPKYLLSLNNLATIYIQLGNYQKAQILLKNITEQSEEILGDKHPDYLSSLHNLAVAYTFEGNYNKALELNLKVVEIKKELFGDQHPDYLISLSTLALIYADLKDFGKALELYSYVTKSQKEKIGENHPDYLASLNNLASTYSGLGNFNKAFQIEIDEIKLTKKILGEYHPDYLICLSNLAITEHYLSNYKSSLNHYLESINKLNHNVNDYFSILPEHQRGQFWKQYSFTFEIAPFFVEQCLSSQPDKIQNVYDVALFTKGLLLNTTRDFEELIQEKGTPEAITKFEELKLLKLQIQKLSEQPVDQRYLDVDSLQDVAQVKETELVKLSQEYGDYTRNLKITWKDVQSRLKEGEVAIEFVEYPTLSDTVKYAALLLKKDWEYPKMIYLFQKDELNNLVNQSADQIYSNSYVGQQIKKLVWEPLKDFVSKGDKVYFSPSGLLHQIAIENLPANDSMTLEEYYPMYRLSSTKELVINKPKGDNKSSALYGGLFYDIDDSIMVAQSSMYNQTNTSAYAMRGYSQDSTLRQGWNYLEGTLTEVDQIGEMMTSGDYQVVKYTGIEGNEESFKALSGRNTGIIHIATHGFFLPIEDTRRNEFMQARLGDQPGGSILSDPMQRSGLMLAGGNKAWQGEEIPTEIEDGVLTAKEISHLDLRGTDLVVLSACETGLGEVSSEGVFGLQRSFKQAGVQSLVMTLWEVNDQATDYFMTEFYKSYLSGKEKRKSFLEAKKSCRHKFPEPQYWAGFVLLD